MNDVVLARINSEIDKTEKHLTSLYKQLYSIKLAKLKEETKEFIKKSIEENCNLSVERLQKIQNDISQKISEKEAERQKSIEEIKAEYEKKIKEHREFCEKQVNDKEKFNNFFEEKIKNM